MKDQSRPSARRLKKWFSPSVGDINGLRGVLLVAAALFVVTTVLGTDGIGWSSGEGAVSSGAASGSGIVVDLDPTELDDAEAAIPVFDRVQAVVPTRGGARALQIIGSVMVAGGVLGAMIVAWVVLTRAARGRLFEPSSWKLLVTAAGVMFVAQIGEAVLSFARMEALDDLGLTPMTSLSFGYGIIGLVFGALARVWQIGSELADDVAYTV